MSRRATALAVLITLLGAVTGCTSANHSTPVHHQARGASSSPSPTPMVGLTAPAGTPLGAGQRVWNAFSERGLAYDAWWARLKPLLSDAARAVYVYDDPRKLPAMRITATIHVAAKPPDAPHYTAEVVVPTSKGVFKLDLARHTLTSPWLLYAISFPRAVQ